MYKKSKIILNANCFFVCLKATTSMVVADSSFVKFKIIKLFKNKITIMLGIVPIIDAVRILKNVVFDLVVRWISFNKQ